MSKIVTFFNKKGGTGKTSLAFSVAKDLGYALLSNDDSVIEEIYPNKAKIIEQDEDMPLLDFDTVYDLGGYLSPHIIPVLKKSSMVVIPTLLDVNSIKRTINTAMEVNVHCGNIVIVINRVQKSKLPKYKQSIDALKGLGKPVLQIRESEAITNSVHTGLSISELYSESGLSRSNYKGIFADYSSLLEIIKEK